MLQYWYHYGIGGVVFLIGLWFCFRQGDIGLGTGKKRKNLLLLLGGLLYFALIHAFFQFVAPNIP